MPKRPRTAIEPEQSTEGQSSTARICVGSYEHVLYGVDATVSRANKTKGTLTVVWNPVYMFEAHTAQIKACAIGGRYLASGGVDEILRLYDLKKRQDLGSLLSHDGSITSITFPRIDGAAPTHMLSSDENNKIIIWRIKDWTPQIQLTTRHGVVNDVSVHPSGKICLSVGVDRHVRLWNLVTGKKAAAFKLGREEPMKVAWNAAGDRYAILFDKSIGIYDMSAVLQHSFDSGRSKFHNLVWSKSRPDGDEVLIGSLDSGVIQVYNPLTYEVVQELKGHKARVKAITTVSLLPSESSSPVTLIVSGSTDGQVKLWMCDQQDIWSEVGSYDCGGGRITCIAACDASVEDLEAVVKRRTAIKEEPLSDEGLSTDGEDEDTEDGHGDPAKTATQGEEEEFAGFD